MKSRKSCTKSKINDNISNKNESTTNKSTKKTMLAPCRRVGLGRKKTASISITSSDLKTENCFTPFSSVEQQNLKCSTSQLSSVSPSTTNTASRRKKSPHPLKRKIDVEEKSEGNCYAVIVSPLPKKRKLEFIDIFNSENVQKLPECTNDIFVNSNISNNEKKNNLNTEISIVTSLKKKKHIDKSIKNVVDKLTSSKTRGKNISLTTISDKSKVSKNTSLVVESRKQEEYSNATKDQLDECVASPKMTQIKEGKIRNKNMTVDKTNNRSKKNLQSIRSDLVHNTSLKEMFTMVKDENASNNVKEKSPKKKKKTRKKPRTPKIKVKNKSKFLENENKKFDLSKSLNELNEDFEDDFREFSVKSKKKITIKNKKIINSNLKDIRKLKDDNLRQNCESLVGISQRKNLRRNLIEDIDKKNEINIEQSSVNIDNTSNLSESQLNTTENIDKYKFKKLYMKNEVGESVSINNVNDTLKDIVAVCDKNRIDYTVHNEESVELTDNELKKVNKKSDEFLDTKHSSRVSLTKTDINYTVHNEKSVELSLGLTDNELKKVNKKSEEFLDSEHSSRVSLKKADINYTVHNEKSVELSLELTDNELKNVNKKSEEILDSKHSSRVSLKNKSPKNKAEKKFYFNDIPVSNIEYVCTSPGKENASSSKCSPQVIINEVEIKMIDEVTYNDDSNESSHYSTPAYSPIEEAAKLPEDKDFIIQRCNIKTTLSKFDENDYLIDKNIELLPITNDVSNVTFHEECASSFVVPLKDKVKNSEINISNIKQKLECAISQTLEVNSTNNKLCNEPQKEPHSDITNISSKKHNNRKRNITGKLLQDDCNNSRVFLGDPPVDVNSDISKYSENISNITSSKNHIEASSKEFKNISGYEETNSHDLDLSKMQDELGAQKEVTNEVIHTLLENIPFANECKKPQKVLSDKSCIESELTSNDKVTDNFSCQKEQLLEWKSVDENLIHENNTYVEVVLNSNSEGLTISSVIDELELPHHQDYYPRILLSTTDIDNYYKELEIKGQKEFDLINRIESTPNQKRKSIKRNVQKNKQKINRKNSIAEMSINNCESPSQGRSFIISKVESYANGETFNYENDNNGIDKHADSVFFTPPSSRSENDSDSNQNDIQMEVDLLENDDPFGEGTSKPNKFSKIVSTFVNTPISEKYISSQEDNKAANISTSSTTRRDKIKSKKKIVTKSVSSQPIERTSSIYDSDDDFQTSKFQSKSIPSKNFIIKKDSGVNLLLKNSRLETFQLTKNKSLTAIHRGLKLEYVQASAISPTRKIYSDSVKATQSWIDIKSMSMFDSVLENMEGYMQSQEQTPTYTSQLSSRYDREKLKEIEMKKIKIKETEKKIQEQQLLSKNDGEKINQVEKKKIEMKETEKEVQNKQLLSRYDGENLHKVEMKKTDIEVQEKQHSALLDNRQNLNEIEMKKREIKEIMKRVKEQADLFSKLLMIKVDMLTFNIGDLKSQIKQKLKLGQLMLIDICSLLRPHMGESFTMEELLKFYKIPSEMFHYNKETDLFEDSD